MDWESARRRIGQDAFQARDSGESSRDQIVKAKPMRAIASLTCAFAFLLAVPSPTRADTRVALVVGNEAYRQMPVLNNPVRDATDVAKVLTSLGFDTQVVTNADRAALSEAIGRFTRKTTGADVALFYFSGHGMQFQGKNYLLPVDADLANAGDVNRFQLLLVDDIIDVLSSASGMKLLVLDACRTNSVERDFKNKVASVPGANRDVGATRGFARVAPRSGLIITYATQADDVANDGSGSHSPFTTAFLNDVAAPNLEVRQMLNKVQSDVYSLTRQTQLPEVSSLYVGPDIFLKQGSTSARQPEADISQSRDELAWSFVRTTTDVGSLRQFVAEFPASSHRPDAERRIADLSRPADPPRPPPSADKPYRVAALPSTPTPHSGGESCASRSTAAGVDRYCASSVLAPEFGNSYRVQNLFGGDPSLAWVEGKPGYGVGETITVEFDGPRKIRSVRVDNGYQKSSDIYYKNTRVKSVRLTFSSGDHFDFPLRDAFGTQTLTLPHPVDASWMQLLIQDIYPGSKYTDTAISKLYVDSEAVQ